MNEKYTFKRYNGISLFNSIQEKRKKNNMVYKLNEKKQKKNKKNKTWSLPK